MFDRPLIQITRTSSGPSHVTVTEKRAPTDDSIRLAAEYEEKAWQKVTGHLIEQLPTIDAKVIAVEGDFANPGTHYLFSINNQKVRLFVGNTALNKSDMVEKVSEAITGKLMEQLFQKTAL